MSCFGGKEEQLYLLELMVGKLRLLPEKMKDVGDRHLVIKIKFVDFPVFEISRGDFTSTKPSPPDTEDGSLDFSAGKSCLFTKQPRDLVLGMQSNPLRVGVFCTGDTYPIAESEVPMSGCLCDQVAMAMNDPDHLPKPYTLKGGFHLKDPGDNPSGIVSLDLRLTCFGKSITTHYQLQPKSFLFKNDKERGEFCVRRVVPPPLCGDQSIKVIEDGQEMQVGKCGDSMLPDTLVEDVLPEPPVPVKEEKITKGAKGVKKEKLPKGEKGKKKAAKA
ncbi:uncharacterized protein LOC124405953 [Diprion similis]|uniref:uncharacterized protein LOC124405953 n=1 Tax=Diprion similis TaxID=362088 RepID=UPI001EF933F9|nr:uncharacterized protein LOC124405953 [Diprion similis]